MIIQNVCPSVPAFIYAPIVMGIDWLQTYNPFGGRNNFFFTLQMSTALFPVHHKLSVLNCFPLLLMEYEEISLGFICIPQTM